MTLLNCYGTYGKKKVFWDELMSKSIISSPKLIIRGTSTLLWYLDILSPKENRDPLVAYFLHHLEYKIPMDVKVVKLISTWRNMREREDQIAKRLDRFLVTTPMIDKLNSVRKWVGCRGELDHNPIFLEWMGFSKIPPSLSNSTQVG